jgi:hypothetical protein
MKQHGKEHQPHHDEPKRGARQTSHLADPPLDESDPHGGARGSGGPAGERNGNFRHGYFTAENVVEREAAREVIRQARKVLGPVR